MVLILAGLVIAYAATRGKKDNGVSLKTEVAKRGDFVIKINASGNLESLLTVQVKSNVEGEIQKLAVKEGEFVEKGQVLIQINDKQIKEDMKQAEANVAAAQAQMEQAIRSLEIKKKQLDSDLQQQRDAVVQAQTSYNVVKATTLQQISQQETDIQTTKDSMEQDNIALRQAEIAAKQASLSLDGLKQSESAAKVDLDNAESELKRTQELYEKKYVPKKSLEDAQASYANSKSRYESAQKNILSQQETIKSQQEAVDMRKNAVQMRKTTLVFEGQNLKLLKQTREAQEEQAVTQLKIANTRLKQLEENINDEKDVSKFSLESARANLLRNQSTLNNEKERLGWTTIIAPVSGIVTNLVIKEGEIVTSGRSAFSQSPALMQVADLSQMIVRTSINEVDMEKIAIGQKVEIKTKAYPDKVYRGEVSEVAPSGSPRDNIIYFQVEISVLDSPKELRPGMTADVDIVVVERKDELLLPIEAVKSEQASAALLTVSDVSQLKVGQSVELESERGAKFQGTVSKLISDSKEGNVEVTLASAKKGVRPGKTTFKLTVNGNTIPDIPAVVRSGKESYVMLMPKGKGKDTAGSEAVKGIRTLIEVGEQNNAEIEILSGLNAGDQVIIPSPTVPEAGQTERRR
jgi:RND family efflux transporter MFP subunit